jgi:hypothetical protein
MQQLDLEEADFRSCVGGLAKICKRLEILYPIRTDGYNQASRSYTLPPSAKRTVLAVAEGD